MKKSVVRFNWEKGYTKVKTLSRSFDTLEEASRFADGKRNAEIYRSNGRYKVEYIKEVGLA